MWGILFRDLHRAARGIQVAARVDDQPHAVFGHGREQCLAVSDERLIVIMGVGVKNQDSFLLLLKDEVIFKDRAIQRLLHGQRKPTYRQPSPPQK